MTEKALNLYKPRGETPLQTLEAFQKSRPEYAEEKMTYAGRLDPMAEGVLVALVGDETKNREAYTDLPKEYSFEWIFGLSTDTYDLLGLPEKIDEDFAEPDEDEVADHVRKTAGKLTQAYPPFSSKVVGGKSLFSLAKAGKIRESDLPRHEVEIYKTEYLGSKKTAKEDLENFILKTVSSVDGDFRQKQVMADWKNRLSKSNREEYTIHSAKIGVSSGFYVRQFVHDLGVHFKTKAVTFSILRTRVGGYPLEQSLRLH